MFISAPPAKQMEDAQPGLDRLPESAVAAERKILPRLISPKAGQFPERLIWYVGTEGGRIYICAPDLSRWLFVKGDEVLLSQRGYR